MPFPNEVYIDPKDKKRLIKLLSESDEILEKYPYSSDASHHTVTCMSRAKSSVYEANEQIKLLYTKEEKK